MIRLRPPNAIGAVAIAMACTAVDAAQRPAFRSEARVVRVDVSVQQDGRPVTDLTAGDFELRDNGVAQRIEDFSYGRLPIDVTVALDVSGSVSGQLLGDLRRSIADLQARLREGDRLKLLAFNQRIRRLLDYAPPDTETRAAFAALSAGGGTAIFDMLGVALLSAAPPDRRQLIIVFTDGADTDSITVPADLVALARRTTPTLAFVGPFDASTGPPPLPDSVAAEIRDPLGRPQPARRSAPLPQNTRPRGAAPSRIYNQLAVETGGVIVSLPGGRGANLRGTFGEILDDFRSSYVLYFTPRSTDQAEFHALSVSVARAGLFDVRARRGYVQE